MTQEDKDLLLRDLCARLPYGVKLGFEDSVNVLTANSYDVRTNLLSAILNTPRVYSWTEYVYTYYCYRPYLRPMSSMTEEEEIEFIAIRSIVSRYGTNNNTCILGYEEIDWLNAHHFDYRGLIDKGLALEAPEGMYNTE